MYFFEFNVKFGLVLCIFDEVTNIFIEALLFWRVSEEILLNSWTRVIFHSLEIMVILFLLFFLGLGVLEMLQNIAVFVEQVFRFFNAFLVQLLKGILALLRASSFVVGVAIFYKKVIIYKSLLNAAVTLTSILVFKLLQLRLFFELYCGTFLLVA